MKRKITLSRALVLTVVLVSPMISDSTAKAQQPQKYSADTGVVRLGPDQILRIVVGAGAGGGPHVVRFKQAEYMQGTCSGGVCKLTLASQSITNPMTLMPDEGVYFDIGPDVHGNGVRGSVLSNSGDVRVTAMIIDATTSRIIAIWVPQGSPAVGKE